MTISLSVLGSLFLVGFCISRVKGKLQTKPNVQRLLDFKQSITLAWTTAIVRMPVVPSVIASRRTG
jgi:hypothetical protein